MNILAIMTITVMVLMTGYSIYLTHREYNKINPTPGMTISMSVAMMTGLLSGFLIGVYTGDMFLSSGVSMIIGFTVGFLAGQPVGLMAILAGSLAGLISGLMGAVLGVMLQYTTPTIMLIILLLVYVIILGLVIVFILVETNDKLSLDTQGISPFAILSAGVALLIAFLFLYSSDLVEASKTAEAPTASTVNQATGEDINVSNQSSPAVNLAVTENGYSPNVIYVRKGVPVKLVVTNPLQGSCLSTFNLPDFKINNVNLKTGTTNLYFTPNRTGKFTFSCGMNMFKGTLLVK